MTDNELPRLLQFVRDAERLKDVLRSAHTSQGRRESTAEHTWRLCLLAMVLEPTSLDPTTAAAAAIGEIVHYNVLEGLTKIEENGTVSPLLAKAWTRSYDGKTYTFVLRQDVHCRTVRCRRYVHMQGFAMLTKQGKGLCGASLVEDR